MIQWQKKLVPAGTDEGEPGDLPLDLQGLTEESLADLDWTADELGYRGFGFVPVPDLNSHRAAKLIALTAKRDSIYLAGWTHDFGGAIGTHTLDLRNADDKANWHLLLAKTDKMIAAGLGSVPVKIRTAADISIEVSATVANAAMNAFLAWGEDVMSYKWLLDDAIQAAGDFAALDAIDIMADWPGSV